MVCAWSNEALDCSVAHQLYHINSNFFVPKEEHFSKITTTTPYTSPSIESKATTVPPKEQRSNGRRLDANYNHQQQVTNEQSETKEPEYGLYENDGESLEFTTSLPYEDRYLHNFTELPLSEMESTKLEASTVQPEIYGDNNNTTPKKNTPSFPKTNIQGSVIIGNQEISYQSTADMSSQNNMHGLKFIDNSTLESSKSRNDNVFHDKYMNTSESRNQENVHIMESFKKTNSSLLEDNILKENVTKSLESNSSVSITQTQIVHSISTTLPTISNKLLSTTMRSRGTYRFSVSPPTASNREQTNKFYLPQRNRINSSNNNESSVSSTIVSVSPSSTSSNNNENSFYTTSTLNPISTTTEKIMETTSTIANYNPFHSYRFTAAPTDITQMRESFRYSRPYRNQNRDQHLSLLKLSTVQTPTTKVTTPTASTLQDVTVPTTVKTSTLKDVTTTSTVQTTSGSYRFTAPPRKLEVTRSWMSFRASLRSRANYKYSR
ncbi:unnamed protein product, partial [Meganyctiphanes norvegica]